MNIAIVRLSSLGDIIFAMASLQLIRRRFPAATITWVADSRFADILDHNPDISAVVKLDLKGLKRDFAAARLSSELSKLSHSGDFDLVIDMHGMLKAAVIAWKLGGPRVGFDWSTAKESLASLFYGKRCRVPSEVVGVRRFASLAGFALDFSPEESELTGHAPFLFYAPQDLETVSGFFSGATRNVIMVAGTSIAYKDYPATLMAEVARRLDAQVLVCHGNERERASAEQIATLAANATVLPKLTLNQLKALIGKADLVIGGDTGPTHIAWAMNVPSITLFGATPPDCIVPTACNRVITSGSRINYSRPDSNDLSIQTIPVDEIIRVAGEVLL